jgi:hypothetical protein
MDQSIILVAGRASAGPFEVFAINDPIGETYGILAYMVVPVIVGASISYLFVLLSDIQRNARRSIIDASTISLMFGVLSYVLAIFVYLYFISVLMSGWSIIRIFGAILISLAVTAPIYLITGPLVVINLMYYKIHQRNLPIYIIYLVLLSSMMMEYFYIGYFFKS